MIHCIKVLFLCQIWNRRLIQGIDLLFRLFMPRKADTAGILNRGQFI